MRISRFTIKNYKGIDSLELEMPKTIANRPASGNLLSIIGKNNAGKSSILNALQKALELGRASTEDFPHHKPEENPISVEIEFDEISDADKAKPAIGPHRTPDNTYIIRIDWASTGAPSRKVKDAQLQFNHPENPRKKDSWLNHESWKDIISIYEKQHGTFALKSENITKLEQIALAEKKTSLYRLEEWQDEDKYRPNPAGWQSLLLNALPRVVYVPAIRETKDETEVGKKGATIRQLVSYMFEKQLDTHKTIQSLKAAALKVSKLFAQKEKDEIVLAMEKSINDILTPLAGVTGHLGYSNKDIIIDLGGYTYYSIKDEHGPETKPEHHGHGTQRALILSLLQALAELESSDKVGKGLLLLFEEPEIYLHPEMCRKMRDTLITISRRKDSQVICTTHSPVLLDLAERHDGIALLKKDPTNGKVTCFQRTKDIFNDQEEKEARQRLRMLLNFDPAVNELFFSERVCLVEGDTEMAAIGAVAEKLIETGKIDREKYQRARHEMTMISCRGKATIPAFQKVLNEFGIKYRVVHDSDSDKNSAALQTLNAQIALLMKQAYPTDAHVHTLVHEPNFEQQNLKETFNNDKPWRTATNIHLREKLDSATDLLKYFEFALQCPITALAPEPLPTKDESISTRRTFDAPRRNTRHNYQPYRDVLLRDARRLASNVVIGIAAGPGHIDDLEEFFTSDHLAGDMVIAKVRGNSMLDTLRVDDLVLLRKLENIYLPPVEDKDAMISMDRFKENISNNRIYVVAINDGIERNEYTIKRVLFSGSGVDWICRIVADNPEVEWCSSHSRGEFVVRRTDRIHFAAELVALVKDAERPSPAVELPITLSFKTEAV